MTSAQRLAKVEAALTPKQLVLRWLEEAHRYGDMPSFMRSLIDKPPLDYPLDRLVREAREGGRVRSRGAPRAEAERLARRSMVEAAFLFLLVLEINVRSQDFLDRERLIHALLVSQVGLALNEDDGPLQGRSLARLVGIRDLMLQRVDELHAFETARARVEQRYLDGASAVFPVALTAWTKQGHDSKLAAVTAVRLAELDGAQGPPEADAVSLEARISKYVEDFVQPARSKAYNELGDGRTAHRIASEWLMRGLLSEPD